MARKDPFRTLDDPTPAPAAPLPDCSVRSDQIGVGVVSAAQIAHGKVGFMPDIGYWAIPSKRPNAVRRLFIWLLLGWKWHKL